MSTNLNINGNLFITQTDINGYTWPVYVNNTGGGTATLYFNGNTTISTDRQRYFIINTNNITVDGQGYTVTINGINNYPGLIENGTTGVGGSGKSNVTIKNISVANNGSSLANLSGWLCHSYFSNGSSNNNIINCNSTGIIDGLNCGGIVGAYVGFNNGTITIMNCFSTGGITGDHSGGIAGIQFAHNTNQLCIITNCYSIGVISGDSTGGIVGAEVGYTDANFTPKVNITNCYSWGNIGSQSPSHRAGGICGGTINGSYQLNPVVQLQNCYSFGSVAANSNGLVAPTLQIYANISISNCYIANSNWSDVTANTSLTGIGTTWCSIAINNPYRLSVYNRQLYNPNNAVNSLPYTSAPGLISNSGTYSIITINALNPSLFSDINISSSSGSITFNSGLTGYSNYIVNVIQQQSNGSNYNINSFTFQPSITPPPLPCFLEGTKILTDNGYIPIEKLEKGMLIQTYNHGLLPLGASGYRQMYNTSSERRFGNRLFILKSQKYPELEEDLILTGNHCILVDKLEKKTYEQMFLGSLGFLSNKLKDNLYEMFERTHLIKYLIDDKYGLTVYSDLKSEPYKVEGYHTIWHLAMDSDDDTRNYGIYVNGLLVEACSKDFLLNKSCMTLK